MKIMGIDVETTGLDHNKDEIIELGAVVWDTDLNLPTLIISELIYQIPPLRPEITKITGITDSMLQEYGRRGVLIDSLYQNFFEKLLECDYAMAHNASFDRGFIEKEAKRYGIDLSSVKWIDTQRDLPLSAYGKSRSLTYLAADHGFLNPFSHRAVFDVLTMLKVASCYPIATLIERSESPKMLVEAQVDYFQRDLAKSKGFSWNPDKKTWEREVKLCDVELESELWDFKFTSRLLTE